MTCSIIILSYNTGRITDECLRRVKIAKDRASKKGIRTEVVVIDNGSSDESVKIIDKKYPWVKLIVSKINTGFTGGNNLGMKKSIGKYILLLNSDTYVDSDTIMKSVEYMKINHRCDVLGCKLLNKDGSLQPSAGFLPEPINTLMWLLGMDWIRPIHPKKSNFFSGTKQVGWVMGAFMLMNRKVYELTKGFDEKLFMYMEEVEWCKRIGDRGFKIWYVPDFAVTHLGQASSGYDFKKPLLRELQALPYYFSRHYPSWQKAIQQVEKVGVVLRWMAFGLLGQKVKADIYKEIMPMI